MLESLSHWQYQLVFDYFIINEKSSTANDSFLTQVSDLAEFDEFKFFKLHMDSGGDCSGNVKLSFILHSLFANS